MNCSKCGITIDQQRGGETLCEECYTLKVAREQGVIISMPKNNKYGLSVDICIPYEKGSLMTAIKRHILVTHLLDTNGEYRKRYKNDQTGELKYFDLLDIAERQLGKG